MPLAGKLAEQFGRKRVFIVARRPVHRVFAGLWAGQ